MPRVLMACSIYWTSALRVGSHHIAKALVRKGWEVGFVSYPISPWHMLRETETDFRARLALHRSGGSRFLNGRLWAYVPFAPLVPANVPFLRSAWTHRNWLRLSIPNLVRTLRSNGFSSVDTLYIDSPAMACLLSPTLKYRKSVYRLADRTDAFDFAVPAFLEMERELAAAVDVVAYTAETLQTYAAALGPRRIAHLPNAVDLETFTGGTAPLPPEYVGLARPIAVYAGAMHHWFDFDLVNKVTELLPEISFVFIGPDTLARTRLFLRPNVHVLGPRPHGRLPEYLANADIALIPFDTRRFAELVGSVNPLKLYEYMACGLPVVATKWPELERLGAPACLVERDEDFAEAIRATLAQPPPRKELLRFARMNSWERRVEQLLNLLGLVQDGRVATDTAFPVGKG